MQDAALGERFFSESLHGYVCFSATIATVEYAGWFRHTDSRPRNTRVPRPSPSGHLAAAEPADGENIRLALRASVPNVFGFPPT